jgi:hypothetical protein
LDPRKLELLLKKRILAKKKFLLHKLDIKMLFKLQRPR